MPISRNIWVAWCLITCGCCAIHLPDHCKPQGDTRQEQRNLLQLFEERRITLSNGRIFTVFTPKEARSQPERPPVLVLHEMPALSPDVLELGLRLKGAGYSVYIPLLWGSKDENASSNLVFLRYAVELTLSPRWQVEVGNADRPILNDLGLLCREYILPEHPNKHLGIIGNCLTGIFPLALAARVPQVTAPVASQPAIPLIYCGKTAQLTGLSVTETAALTQRMHDDRTFQLLGFRFQKDRVSPPDRFATLRSEFADRFLDATIPSKIYHDRDGLPLHAHPVLTRCYTDRAPCTVHAWHECLAFLAAKLRATNARLYRLHPY
jgi:dienelactone hydrolase